MWRKHFFGICLALFIFSSCTLFYLLSPPLTSDKKLTESFYKNQANFKKLVKMADEDSNVTDVFEDFVLLNGYKNWRDDSQEGFSTKRWNEYKKLFNELGNSYIHRISKENGIVQIASASIATSDIDEYESVVISKGYAYSLREPSPLVESLDGMDFNSHGDFYKKIDDHWYLYFHYGISKPE